MVSYINLTGNFQAISRNDQLLPYFVMDVARSFKGLPGLFIAGIVSAALGYVYIQLQMDLIQNNQ